MKAQLTEITWDENDQVQTVGEPFDVQFNPETLSVTYSNQKSGGDQRGGAALQFVGQGQTKLSVQLWYDVTQPLPDNTGVQQEEQGGGGEGASPVKDVRRLTEPVVALIKPKPQGEGEERTWKAPGVRFQWGSFLFEGVLDSLTDKLEFFSEDGLPLRSQITLSLTSQEIQHRIEAVDAAGDPARRAAPPTPGTRPRTPAREGDSLQQMASRAGRPDAWQEIARANGIENPRRLDPGQLLDLTPPGLRRAGPASVSGHFGAPPLPS